MLYSQQQILIFICFAGISFVFAETTNTLLCYNVTGSFYIIIQTFYQQFKII